MSNEIYLEWLNNSNVSELLKIQMKSMSETEKAIAFNDKKIQFGTAGYRAKMGPGNHYLNEFTYKQLATGYAKFIKEKFHNLSKIKVLVVHDNRLNGAFFTDIVCTTLEKYNIIPVITKYNELLPTPIASYLVRKMKLHGCINITASHNPKEYNGFKCYDSTGAQLLPNDSKKIIDFLPSWKEVLETKIEINFKPYFVPKIFINRYFIDVYKSLIKTKYSPKYLNLVYSAMHGTASNYMSSFLNKLGYKCIDLVTQNYPDPNFTNTKICNPEDPQSLEDAINFADIVNSNIVLASDPDADRLAIVIKKDNEWVFLNGNQAGIIETYYKLHNLKIKNKFVPVVISTYISTNLIDKIVKQFNGKVIRTPTGFKWIANEINNLRKNEVYINGFEEAIGALPSTINRDKDSFQTAALIMEIIYYYHNKSMDLVDLLEKEIYPKYGHWYGETTSIVINDLNWKEKALLILEKLKTNDLGKICNREIVSKNFNEKADAMEYYFEGDSWVKFRISGTEPKFKIYTNLFSKNDNFEYDTTYTKQLQIESFEIVEFIKKYLGL